MEFYRARQCELECLMYDTSYIHNTALIAEDDGEVIGSMEYRINGMEESEIISFLTYKPCDVKEVLKGLVDEMLYWNPYLKRILYNQNNKIIKDNQLVDIGFIKDKIWILNRISNISIFKVDIEEITPEQLTVDKVKIDRAISWIEKPEDIIVNCVKIHNKLVCIDGYSRLIAAYKKGFEYVYAYVDEEATNLDFYEVCLSWCEKEGVRTIKDLLNRIVMPEEHQKLWINRCQRYLKEQMEKDE